MASTKRREKKKQKKAKQEITSVDEEVDKGNPRALLVTM